MARATGSFGFLFSLDAAEPPPINEPVVGSDGKDAPQPLMLTDVSAMKTNLAYFIGNVPPPPRCEIQWRSRGLRSMAATVYPRSEFFVRQATRRRPSADT